MKQFIKDILIASTIIIILVVIPVYIIRNENQKETTQIKEAKYNVFIHTSNSTRLELVNEIHNECRKTSYSDLCQDELLDYFMNKGGT